MKIITRAVLILSVVSLLNDISSEMLIPVMPAFLKSIGFTAVLIGVLEGMAEAVAGLSKGYFGNLSDRIGKRLPLVRLGYFLSAISKAMLGIFTYTLWIFTARTMDRIGKGIRTGARDALLSDETSEANKGKVFGFHRGMDTLGAVLGPAIALVYLHLRPGEYQSMFLLTFIPGIICVGFLYLLKEKKQKSQPKEAKKFVLGFWKNSSREYKRVVGGLLVFAIFNSSNIFLLLMMKQKGLSDEHVLEVYIFYNIIYALGSYPFGHLGDKIGMKAAFIIGLLLFAVVYAGMAFTDNLYIYYALFFLYGLYSAATDGISSAWVSNIMKGKNTATGLGTYAGLNSICLLFSSILAGLVWDKFGPSVTFIISAVGAAVVAGYFGLSARGGIPASHRFPITK